MLKMQVKNIYFGLVRWISLPYGLLVYIWYRFFSKQTSNLALHLGCGNNYILGMVNIEGNIFKKKDLLYDLRNRLPFPKNFVRFVYSSHTLEHLYPDEAINLLKEIYRVLKPNGIARIVVPSFEHTLAIANDNNVTNFYPRGFSDPLSQAIDYLFCDGQHKYGYSFGVMKQFAAEAGFINISQLINESAIALKTYGAITVGQEPVGSLVIELRKI